MHFKRSVYCRILAACAAWLCAFNASNAYAVQADEEALKAAFIYNFSLFTTWPQLKETIHFCVIGENVQLNALKQYEGRKVADATVHVKEVSTIEESRTCEVLFIQTSNPVRAEQLYQALAQMPILTVAEYKASFSQPAAIILFVQSNNRLAFEINHNIATEAKLSVSYKLLRLARKVNMASP